MIDKCLIALSTFNAPVFLQCLLESFDKYNPGYPCDLLIWDCENTNAESIKLLDLARQKHNVLKRPNVGRAQAGYNQAFQQFPDYEYYFFMHDDSCFMQDNWLLKGIERLHDDSVEHCLSNDAFRGLFWQNYPVGKIGYCSYEYGTIDKYLRSEQPAIFRFMRPLIESQTELPHLKYMLKFIFQHIADDRILYSNQCLKAMKCIHHIEAFRKPDGTIREPWIGEYFAKNYPGRGFIEPRERYNNADWEGYQSWCEFTNDILPFHAGYRTHNLYGDGYCQEDLGFTRPWACGDVVHWGAHNTFKFLAHALNTEENKIQEGYKDIDTLRFFAEFFRELSAQNGSDNCYAQQSSAS